MSLMDCQDPDCVGSPEITVCTLEASEELCTDQLDNDEDGDADCRDFRCRDAVPTICRTETRNSTCDDGVDKDGDGWLDCEDKDCWENGGVTVCGDRLQCLEDDASTCEIDDGVTGSCQQGNTGEIFCAP